MSNVSPPPDLSTTEVNEFGYPPQMLARLAQSGITPTYAYMHGWRYIQGREHLHVLGFIPRDEDSAIPDGILIPFFDPVTGRPLTTPDGKPFCRVRLFRPAVIDGDGKPAKYLSPHHGGNQVFVLPEVIAQQAADPRAPLYLTEGEFKAVCATILGLPMIGLTGIWGWVNSAADRPASGEKDLHPMLVALVHGRVIVLILDSDAVAPSNVQQFRECTQQFAACARKHGATAVHLVILPNLTPDAGKTGVDDYLVAGGKTIQCLLNHITSSQREVDPDDQRPTVFLPGGGTPMVSTVRGIAQVLALKGDFYTRQRRLVQLAMDDGGQPSFHELMPLEAISELELHLRFDKRVMRNDTPAQEAAVMSEAQARAILAAPELHRRLPVIKQIVDYPCPVWNGPTVVLTAKGHDPRTGIWTNPSGPDVVALGSVQEACSVLFDLLQDFCWAPSPRPEFDHLFPLNAVVYLLTAHCRLLYEPDRGPLFAALANRPGLGKDLLIGIPALLTTGCAPPSSPPPENAGEMRKRIFAACRRGSRFMLISNVRGHLANGPLEQALTAAVIEDRLLGFTENATYPNTAIYAISGNGLTFNEDMGRRVIRLCLAYYDERIETRVFRYPDLYAFIRQNRPRLLGALQTLVEKWVAHGCPLSTKVLPSFVRWSQIIGGIMEACGLANPITEDRVAEEGDQATAQMASLLQAWHTNRGLVALAMPEIRAIAQSLDLFNFLGDLHSDRRAQTKFGSLLASYNRRVFGGLRLMREANVRSSFRLEVVA